MLGVTLSIPHFEKCLTMPLLLFSNRISLLWLFIRQWNSSSVSPTHCLLLTFTAVNEVTYVIGFTCDRLLDVVCFRVMVTGYGCGEVSFFADGTSWVRFTRPESRCCWLYVTYIYVEGELSVEYQ